MTLNVKDLSKYSLEDVEKTEMIDEALNYKDHLVLECKPNISRDFCEDYSLDSMEFDKSEIRPPVSDKSFSKKSVEYEKVCPECGRKFPKSENVCLDCSVRLKPISDIVDVKDIKANPQFDFEGKNNYDDFESLLSKSNLAEIREFDFTYADFQDIFQNIKSQAFKNFDEMVKANGIDFDSLDILDKILLFAKSFVNVEYKSYGQELGYFEIDTIYIDDRQSKSLQITTLLHELSHFLIQEFLIHSLCKILDASRNSYISSLVTFILAAIPFVQLIDEYAAHDVEGRFTIFGFQDYSSFIQIVKSLDGEMTSDEIEITKSIGNTFALHIKDILESLIDTDLREDIKDQFSNDVFDIPNYDALKMENCQILNEEGFVKSLWLILNDGCEIAVLDIDRLKQIE